MKHKKPAWMDPRMTIAPNVPEEYDSAKEARIERADPRAEEMENTTTTHQYGRKKK